MTIAITIISSLLFLIVGLVVGSLIFKSSTEKKLAAARGTAELIVEDAKKEAETTKKEALLEAKEENHRLRTEIENELRGRRTETQKAENRLLQREENLDRKDTSLSKREATLERKEESISKRQQQIEEKESKLAEMIQAEQTELERISALSKEEAKSIILNQVEEELTHDTAIMVKESENRAKEESDKKQRIFSH